MRSSIQLRRIPRHRILARCAGETAINLRWLLRVGTPEHYKRFRAEAFVALLRTANKVDEDVEDPVLRGTGNLVTEILARELRDAGLEKGDVPKRTGRWGGTLRQRFEALDESGLYDAFFATHSDYVHGSWHELRTFHLQSVEGGYALDLFARGLGWEGDARSPGNSGGGSSDCTRQSAGCRRAGRVRGGMPCRL
ncbi:MAG: DUF5677 domain-containing protein [Bryobacteraceae bacterium]